MWTVYQTKYHQLEYDLTNGSFDEILRYMHNDSYHLMLFILNMFSE